MTGGGEFAPCRMANVLKHEEQEQIRALGRLGWSLRRIEEATGVRRETIARYLRWSGIRLPKNSIRNCVLGMLFSAPAMVVCVVVVTTDCKMGKF